MKRIVLILLTFNFIFAYVGKVTALIGKADIIRSGKTIPAKISMDLDNKDIIKTYSESKMQIVFNDNSVITIGKNSTFKIEDYVFDEQPKARFKVLNGAIKSLTGRIGKIAPNKFKIETKNAVIGIRGTEFVVEYKNEITKVGVLYGKVEFVDKISNVSKVVSEGQLLIFNPKTPKKKIIIKQGFKEPKAFKVKPKKSKKSTSGENKKTATQSKKTAQANKSEQTNKSSQNKQAAKSEQKSQQTQKNENKQSQATNKTNQTTQSKQNNQPAANKTTTNQTTTQTTTQNGNKPIEQTNTKEVQSTAQTENSTQTNTENEQSVTQNEEAQIAQSRENENIEEVSQNENTQTEEVTANIQTQQTETANNDIQIEINTPQETANVDTSDVENIAFEISQETATVDDEKKQNDVEENVQEHLENNQPDNNDQQGNTDNNQPDNNDQQGNTDNNQPDNNDQQGNTDNNQPDNNDQQGNTDNNQPDNNDQQGNTDNNQPDNNDQQGNTDDNGQISMDDIKPPLFPDVVDNSELKNDNELVINTALKESSEELKNYGIENGYFDSVTVDISSNKNTPVDIYVDNKLYQTVIVNGDKEVELNLPAGEHNIQVVYNGENVDLGNVVVVKKEDFDKYSQEGIFPPNLPSEDDLDKQTLYSDSYLSYGYWANDNNEFVDTWIEGTVTPEDAVNNLITNQVTASYQGGLAAFINGEQSNGNININIDFGNMEFDGNMKFGESEKYSVDFSGDINVHGFETRNVSAADDSDVEIQSGEINGKFYGNNAEAVGGEFELNDNVKGVYQAIKK